MVTWAELSAAAPDLAAEGRRLFYRGETGEALLATVRGDEPPRIHPIWVAIIDDRLTSVRAGRPGRSARRWSVTGADLADSADLV